MKKLVLLLLISMISSFGAFAKSPKHKVKKAVVVGSCTSYPVMRGYTTIGNEMVCTDNAGRVTRYRTLY